MKKLSIGISLSKDQAIKNVELLRSVYLDTDRKIKFMQHESDRLELSYWLDLAPAETSLKRLEAVIYLLSNGANLSADSANLYNKKYLVQELSRKAEAFRVLAEDLKKLCEI